jgi:hypothetical protein
MTQPGPTPAPKSPAGDAADDPAVDAVTTGADETVNADETGKKEPQPTLLEQMGGISGLIYSSVPVLVFVAVYLPTQSLAASIWSAVGSAVAILIWRLIRREPIQPAISGVLGVAVAAFIAYRTGSARGYFLFGIWTSLLYGGVFLISAVVRWPLAGVVWSVLNGTGMAWRSDPKSRRYYDVATVVWVLVFGARFVVQQWLYASNEVGWLGVARLAMGWPLTAIAALVTVWAVRKADLRHKELHPKPEEPETADAAEPVVDGAADGVPADTRARS